MIQFQENNYLTDDMMEGWTDPISKYNVSLNKSYFITVCMQKIIWQILGSDELIGHVHVWPHPPKNHWNNF